jgi:hypothetical protein
MAANLELVYKCLLNCFLVGLGKRAKLADPRMRIQRQNPQFLDSRLISRSLSTFSTLFFLANRSA